MDLGRDDRYAKRNSHIRAPSMPFRPFMPSLPFIAFFTDMNRVSGFSKQALLWRRAAGRHRPCFPSFVKAGPPSVGSGPILRRNFYSPVRSLNSFVPTAAANSSARRQFSFKSKSKSKKPAAKQESKNMYDLLGVHQDAEASEIKKQYMKVTCEVLNSLECRQQY